MGVGRGERRGCCGAGRCGAMQGEAWCADPSRCSPPPPSPSPSSSLLWSRPRSGRRSSLLLAAARRLRPPQLADPRRLRRRPPPAGSARGLAPSAAARPLPRAAARCRPGRRLRLPPLVSLALAPTTLFLAITRKGFRGVRAAPLRAIAERASGEASLTLPYGRGVRYVNRWPGLPQGPTPRPLGDITGEGNLGCRWAEGKPLVWAVGSE